MVIESNIDILEQYIHVLSPHLLKILLRDKTTGRYIHWACDEYLKYGEDYAKEKEILPELIIDKNTTIIQPRIAKNKEEQKSRTHKSAEVFTPSWICNEMNNLCDEEWFGYKNVFNFPQNQDWIPNEKFIDFNDKDWKSYVDSRRLEITCGEAPYLVSRYDTTTGEILPIIKRIGILDRKLRVVNENTTNDTDWFNWVKRAFESTYGYEYQGDNLLLARENLLWTFIDYYQNKYHIEPSLIQIEQIANIISWNIWQMDGLTDSVPFTTTEQEYYQPDLFGNEIPTFMPVLCKIKDWRSGKTIYFKDLKGAKK